MHPATIPSSNSSPGWCVRVDCTGQPPQQFNTQEICKIFQGYVGTVVRISESLEGGKKWMRVTFRNEDEYKKALCMSGYSVGGTSIKVSSFSTCPILSLAKPRAKHLAKLKRSPDTRRNLYVLNVPHDLSAQAYHDLFAPHGTPTHTVLLKTQDSCSRRRGFVVMSTHHEAQDVINWLDGICIRGFQLRVTWANIDRSNGFLSGYDRTNFAKEEVSSVNPTSIPSNPSIESKSIGIGMDTSTIVASNIPMSLFPASEIDILFKPFGPIKGLQLISPDSSLNHPLATLAPASPLAQTAIVTFEKAADAIAAKNTLHGQVYEGFGLAVGFVSNLGQDEDQVQGTSTALDRGFSVLALTNTAASYTGVDSGHYPPQIMPLEQTFRGLPINPYDAMQFQIIENSSARSSYSNWLLCPPLMHHSLACRPQLALESPVPYEPAASIHSVSNQDQDGVSYATYYSHQSSTPL